MERQTPSDNVANSIVVARRWLMLEQLLKFDRSRKATSTTKRIRDRFQ